MRVLVTGAAGFIGSHLCEALLARGDDVVGLDNFDPFYPRSEKERNLECAALAGGGRFLFFDGDIRDRAALDRVFAESVDVVVHLAALAGVRPSIAEPARYQDVNVLGLVNVLEAMRRHAVGRMVFASSSSVYGGSEKMPFTESDAADCPISPYAASKRAGELLVYSYHRLFGLKADCLRFFTVYGPRQRPDLAIRKFAELMLAGKPLPVFGDGLSSRDFTYVGDIVRGVLASVDTASGYRIFNLGGNKTITVRRMVELLERALGKEAVIEWLPCRPEDMKSTWADISRAEAELGYRCEASMEKGIGLFAEWLLSGRAVGTAS